MDDALTKVLLEALPLISQITGGYATLTDSKGVMLTNYDYSGKEIDQFKGRVYDMAVRCIEEKRPLSGPAHYDQDCMAWAVPIGDHVLVSTDTQRIRSQENLKAALKKALPSIVRVVGGYASLCDKTGRRIASYGADGEPLELPGISEASKRAIATKEPIITMSKRAEGAYVVYIPIASDCCLVLNNEATSKKTMLLMTEVKRLQHTKYNVSDIIGQSDAVQQTIVEAMRVARSNSTVLLAGETGTGKEIFAQAIHNAGDRAGKPFVAVNCSAMPASLIESYLFGYEEGAFTGAKKGGMPGAFEQADKGTIFLDEISEMDINLQSKLLRVLQEQEVTRIGSSTPMAVNTRIISASNRNLKELVREKKFREDLYYRLDVISLKIPPLRERDGDISILAEHFLHQYCARFSKIAKRISPDALDALQHYNWPGNVRELENTIEYAANMLNLTEPEVSLTHLPQHIAFHTNSLRRSAKKSLDYYSRSLAEYVAEYEKEIIKFSLEKAKYKTGLVARRLGISDSTLWRKMQKYGLTDAG